MKTFSTSEAKNNWSEIISSAENGEPQIIMENGRKAAVIISFQQFEQLIIDLTKDESVSTDEIDFNGEEFL